MSAVRGMRLKFHPFWTRYRAITCFSANLSRVVRPQTPPIELARENSTGR